MKRNPALISSLQNNPELLKSLLLQTQRQNQQQQQQIQQLKPQSLPQALQQRRRLHDGENFVKTVRFLIKQSDFQLTQMAVFTFSNAMI